VNQATHIHDRSFMSELDHDIKELTAGLRLDPRHAILEVRADPRAEGIALVGESTEPEAVEVLCRQLAERVPGGIVLDEVVRLPDPRIGESRFALIRSAIAPVHAEPRVSSAQVSQYVLGRRLELLSRHGHWWRARGEDRYIGWVHYGYLEVGTAPSLEAWAEGGGGEAILSLGAELCDEQGERLALLPWGARVVRERSGRVRLPDGRQGVLGAGVVVEVERVEERFPPRGEHIVRTARQWMGTPYLWGGVTPAGADCSGFVQAIFALHGIALPRDSDQQEQVGMAVLEGGEGVDFSGLQAGDLLYFAEHHGRVTHVALSLGGSRILHSSLSNGGVAVNDLAGPLEGEERLRAIFVSARRLL
jgi:hypothetical protein